MLAGAKDVLCADIDTYCEAAVSLNAETNRVACAFTPTDLLDAPAPAWAEVILAGDICYEKPLAERVLAWLAAARAAGAVVLIGDPGRSYFPLSGLTRLAEYQVETTRNWRTWRSSEPASGRCLEFRPAAGAGAGAGFGPAARDLERHAALGRRPALVDQPDVPGVGGHSPAVHADPAAPAMASWPYAAGSATLQIGYCLS